MAAELTNFGRLLFASGLQRRLIEEARLVDLAVMRLAHAASVAGVALEPAAEEAERRAQLFEAGLPSSARTMAMSPPRAGLESVIDDITQGRWV